MFWVTAARQRCPDARSSLDKPANICAVKAACKASPFSTTGSAWAVSSRRHLRRCARQVSAARRGCPAVFVSPAAGSPCLFGLLRPAIYLTPETDADETARRHCLAHEQTHYRHGDHIWPALRCVCLVLHWFDPGAFIAPSRGFWRSVGYLLYPAAAIALPRIAMTVKMLKGSITGELGRDYVRTAYSRGNTPRAVLYRHVLRNAVVPTVAFLAMTVADIVAGSVIIEQVFAIPGIGRMLLTSIANRDFPVVQAIVVILALWVVLVNTLADILNQQLDPRLRLR